MNYQNYETVEQAISARVGEINYVDGEQQCVHAVWNILRQIDCKDSVSFETVINGICNAFYAGYDSYEHEENMWNDD